MGFALLLLVGCEAKIGPPPDAPDGGDDDPPEGCEAVRCPPQTECRQGTCVSVDASHVALQASNGQYVVAEGGGGDVVNANRDAIGPWETFGVVCP